VIIQLTKRDDGSLIPADDEASAVISKIPVAEVFNADVQRVRNPKWNSLYWHVMGEIRDNAEDQYGHTKEAISKHILRAVGHVDALDKPLSISFDAMGQSEWEQLWNRVCDWIAVEWDMTDEELQSHIEELTGQRVG
jgi:hypothetical protein